MRLLIFVVFFSSCILTADTIAGPVPDDGYDYEASLATWKADYASEINGRTRDDGIGKYTTQLEWVTAPYIKDGMVVGRHQIWQTNAFYAGENAGKTVRQTVNSYYVDNPEPGPYISLGELKRKYPQPIKKDEERQPDDYEYKFTTVMDSIKEKILKTHKAMVQRTKDYSEARNVYEAENQRLMEKWADNKITELTGEGLKDKDGGINLDVSGGYGSLNPGVSQDELLAWELENSDKARRDMEREYRNSIATDQKTIESMTNDYLDLKKAKAALVRIRSNHREANDDSLVKRGIFTLEKHQLSETNQNVPIGNPVETKRSSSQTGSAGANDGDLKKSIEDIERSFQDLGNMFKGLIGK